MRPIQIIGAALALLLPTLAQAQVEQVQPPRAVTALYDLDSTSETFPILDATPIQCLGRVATSGSSATVTAQGSATPFTDLAVNDKIFFSNPTLKAIRTVITATSSTSAVMDSALNTSSAGAACQYWHMTDGTAVTNGWFEVNRRPFSVSISVVQLDVTGGIDIRLQCALTTVDGTIRPVQVYPALTPPTFTASYTNVTTAGTYVVQSTGVWDRCRVGMKIGSNDDGADTTTHREQISIGVEFGGTR